ncbi:hypothetical protein, partial [Rhizobium leguminosarum]|uniref:hypothetical protein n=1 Tax=Rhizobium leguminosarum TaxID=384 RepID=UPI001953FF5E
GKADAAGQKTTNPDTATKPSHKNNTQKARLVRAFCVPEGRGVISGQSSVRNTGANATDARLGQLVAYFENRVGLA